MRLSKSKRFLQATLFAIVLVFSTVYGVRGGQNASRNLWIFVFGLLAASSLLSWRATRSGQHFLKRKQ